MNLNQLRAFVEVARRLSFSDAARALGVSQPAVTLQIQALEQQLGTQLLERRPKKVSVTGAGEILLPDAVAILERWRHVTEEVAALGGHVTGRLIVGGSTTPSDYLLPQLIGAFRKANPDVMVVLEVGDSGQTIDRLKAGEVELAFVGRETKERRLHCRVWARDRIVVVASPEDALAKSQRPADLARVIAEPLILREKGSATRRTVEAHLGGQGIAGADMNVAFELGSNEGIVNAVAAGLGLAFISEYAVRAPVELGKLAVLDVATLPIERSICLCCPAQPMNRAAQAFLDFAIAHPPA
jgi:DNA-binding transcriptional LysR family regulator